MLKFIRCVLIVAIGTVVSCPALASQAERGVFQSHKHGKHHVKRPGGTITGVITDAQGRPVAGADVRLAGPEHANSAVARPKNPHAKHGAAAKDTAKNQHARAKGGKSNVHAHVVHVVSDANGHFSIQHVTPGKQRVVARKSSLGKGDATVTVVVNQSATANISLSGKSPAHNGAPK